MNDKFESMSTNSGFDETVYTKVSQWLQTCSAEEAEKAEAPEQDIDCHTNGLTNGCNGEDEEYSDVFCRNSDECQPMETEEESDPKSAEMNRFRTVLARNVFGMRLNEFRQMYSSMYGQDVSDTAEDVFAKPLTHTLLFLTDVFWCQPITDPKEIFPYLIHDSKHRPQNTSVQTMRSIPKRMEPTDEESVRKRLPAIPYSSQLFFWFKIKDSKEDMDLKDLSIDYRDYGFDSKLEFFQDLSQSLPIDLVNNRWLSLKPVSFVRQFVAQLAANQRYADIRSLLRVPINSVMPGLQIPSLPIEALFKEFKSHILSIRFTSYLKPKSFCGRITDKRLDFSENFESLSIKMVYFYEKDLNGIQFYSVPHELIIKGFFCAIFCPVFEWIRVQIIDNSKLNKIKVFSIDFGHTLKVEAKDLRLLRQEFAALPAQVIHLSLNGVKRAEGIKSKEWKAFVEKELNKYRDRKETNAENWCQFVSFAEQRIDIIVFNTDNGVDKHYSVNDVILKSKFAQKQNSYERPDFVLMNRIARNVCADKPG